MHQTTRGIISAAGYVPHWRLDRAAIGAFHGSGGKGSRSVASYDQDTTTLAVEAARLARRGVDVVPETLWFATSSPTYAEKTNATVAHAALRLPTSTAAFDAAGAVRSGVGAIRQALRSTGTELVACADIRVGPAGSPDESNGGDGAAALLVGDASVGPLIAEYLGGASLTHEFLDRWRSPGDVRTKQWEERFGEGQYTALGARAWAAALTDAGVEPSDVSRVVISASIPRAANALAKKLGVAAEALIPGIAARIGETGAAGCALGLVDALEHAEAGQVIAVLSLVDGADVLVFRTTDAITAHRSARPLDDQVAAGDDGLPYAKYLAWRGILPANPPNRPEPARASASAAGRSADWKFGFVGSEDRQSGAVHLPPARVSFVGGNVDDMEARPMADAVGTVVTFTIDRLAYSPSPPVIFAVVDFDGGGRLPVELTDVVPADVAVGARVEMTFRRLNAADGIANYFWKARLAGGSSNGGR